MYEYEPVDWDCAICLGRVEALQSVKDAPLEDCPTCGLPVRRVVSRPAFAISKAPLLAKAGSKGFATYKRAEKGIYEKVDGEGVDMLLSEPSKPITE